MLIAEVLQYSRQLGGSGLKKGLLLFVHNLNKPMTSKCNAGGKLVICA